jgi:hypothetical protein
VLHALGQASCLSAHPSPFTLHRHAYCDELHKVKFACSLWCALLCLLASAGITRSSGKQQRGCLCRELLATELVALVGESYSRAYPDIVRAQQCTELSEVIQYLKLQSISGTKPDEDDPDPEGIICDDANTEAKERMRLIRDVWHSRLLGVERSVDVWTGLLATRRLVLRPTEDVPVYLKYATMCRKEGKEQQSWRTLTMLLGYDPMLVRVPSAAH